MRTEMGTPPIRILHTNDLHGRLDSGLVSLIEPYRREADLYFDSGDIIKAGNLAIPMRPEAAWGHLAHLQCSASVPGNRESHILRSALDAKLAGHTHPILCANLYDREATRILPPSLTIECNGLRIGVLGVMVPMVTERMQSKAVSQLIWTPPIPEATSIASELRRDCDLVIALTHIGFRQDQALAQASSDIDLILGGHSHTMLEQPTRVGNTWICQGGSHGRFFGQYWWTMGQGLTHSALIAWSQS
jgi:5'-nucleotidase